MNTIRHFLKVVVLVSLAPLMASAAQYFEDKAPSSLADHLYLSHSKDPVDGGWLPNLTGLPDKDHILSVKDVADIIMEDKDPQCTSIDLHLRTMIFQHFIIYQQMVNAQQIYLDDQIAHQWAHVLAMILKESSGDSTNITDMSGHSISTNEPKTTLQQWRRIFGLKAQSRIKLNDQTNFGLTQTSADRLFDAFRLAQDQKYDTSFLEGEKGASIPKKVELNTAIAIRRLIWFYQDFAQGRIVDSDKRIHQQDISKPEFSTRYQTGLEMALLYCGTRLMFSDEYPKSGGGEMSKLQNAIASIAYCKLGNPTTGYGVNEIDEQCFAEWVTLCPALNIDIALLTPPSYFATQGVSPVCEDAFKRLINKKPGSEQ